MWTKTRARILLASKSHDKLFQKRAFRNSPLRPPATTTKSSRGGGEWRQENTGGGGSGWNQNGSSGRFAGTGSRFLQVVPLPWLAVVCFSAVELATNAYVVENENFRHLTQRCQFHVAACTVGDDSGLGSLFDLLDWVYESIDATGPTALPKLLDEDVIGIALKGTRSPNIKMSTLCHEILNALSSNEHVAAMMAKDPALRAAVVGEVRRQLFGWKSAGSGDNGGDDHEDQGDAAVQAPFAEQALETASAEDGDGLSPSSSPPMSSARQRRRQTGHVVGRGRPDGQRNGFGPRRDATTKYADAGGGGESGDGYRGAGDESGAAAAAVEPEAGEVDAAGLDAADRGVISVDPFYAALTLRTLGNIMRASRGSSSSSSTPTPSAAALASGSSGSSSISSSASDWGRSMTLPLPLRFLYGGNLYGGVERGEAVDGEGSEWPLETRLVGDIAELMLSVSERGGEGVQLVPREPGAEVDEASQMEAQMALQGLESAAASVLRETSCQPQLVGLLMRRRPLVALVTVSWKGHSVRAEDSAAEAALNVCTAYRRLHGLPEPPKPEINFEETWTALTAWANENLADGGIGVVAADLDAREEDQDFIRQAWHAIPSLALSNPVLTVTASAAVGLASIPWGIARRWVAWRRAGETFAALSRLALPRALLWAGLRAGLGATAMTATHGPFGFRSQMRYRTLDATEGRSGTLAMSGVREVADLGYLYVILRLFPYSLLPAVVMSAMLKEGHVGTDTWGP